ncbi:hypothetical protein [Streptomyces sp. NPDC001270]|uniref:hypothetical protein n=1 Tax=Streptomyces sp. NPDC001270 TaxID=3364554 RepID=UPI0036BD6FE2
MTQPAATGEPVSANVSNGYAMRALLVPSNEVPLPSHSSMKSRFLQTESAFIGRPAWPAGPSGPHRPALASLSGCCAPVRPG